MKTAVETRPITEAEMKAIDALMADGVERDQAEAAVRQATDEFSAEPPSEMATNEAEAFLTRYLRRRCLIDSELTRVKDQTKAMIKGLEARLNALDYVCRQPAEAYTKQLLAGKKTKSIKMPHGTVGYRTTPASVEFIDGQGMALYEWCKANCPQAIVQPPPEIQKKPLQEILKLGTADIPGAKLREPYEKFYAV